MRKSYALVLAAVVITVTAVSPALAAVAAPGPEIGAGIPALAGLAYLYNRVRFNRRRK